MSSQNRRRNKTKRKKLEVELDRNDAISAESDAVKSTGMQVQAAEKILQQIN